MLPNLWSQPSWAAWIEMECAAEQIRERDRRSPLGLRGLKLCNADNGSKRQRGRSPLGLRGLKSFKRQHAKGL